MSAKLRLILAGVLVFVGLFGQQIFSFVKENVEIVNIPSVEKEEPNLTYKTLVQDITDLDIEPQDARQLGDFFSELADVVKTDPGFIKTTGVFRDFNVRAGGLNFAGLEIKNKYPSLGQEIDGAIMDTLGDQDVSLTDEKRKELVDCLNAIAWSVNN
tara:strand:- start:178 stop:648 length:471 start_codon:yes stop_codon:yes gene_type:complete